jgi:hypothetical protein
MTVIEQTARGNRLASSIEQVPKDVAQPWVVWMYLLGGPSFDRRATVVDVPSDQQPIIPR